MKRNEKQRDIVGVHQRCKSDLSRLGLRPLGGPLRFHGCIAHTYVYIPIYIHTVLPTKQLNRDGGLDFKEFIKGVTAMGEECLFHFDNDKTDDHNE